MLSRHARLAHATIAALTLVLAACGSENPATATPGPVDTVADAVTVAPAPAPPAATTVPAGTTVAAATTAPAATTVDTTTAAPANVIVNVWSAATVDPARLPIGDDYVSTEGPGVGLLYACSAGNPNAGGASADGPWINGDGTWNLTAKLAVQGSVVWEAAQYTESVADGMRTLTTNSLPVADPTGNFPIDSADPAYAYDRNPGTITAASATVTLPAAGVVADSPTCLREGAVGILRNGVFVFNSLDGRGDDAVAHELQDLCNGHPARTTYHYHNVPNCLRDKAAGASTVVGFAYDGFPIVVERNESGDLPTNADLDECHGRTSPILLDSEVVTTYHYSATLEFPYFIGCYRGTAAV